MDIGLHNLYQRRDYETRWINAENPRGEKHAAAQADEAASLHPPSARWARELGVGWKASPCTSLKPGQVFTVMDDAGPGVIRHIWFTCDAALYRDVIVRMYWDGQAHPSVQCPLGDLFCCLPKPLSILAAPINVNPTGGLNSFFPMPYRKHARITVENDSATPIREFFYAVELTKQPVDDDALYFHAQFRRSNPLAKDTEYVIADGIEGAGHYVGTFMTWRPLQDGAWNEGEVKFHLNGDPPDKPTLCGTGTEDYFLGAWGFGTDFAAPYGGKLQVNGRNGEINARALMYRFHVLDPIFFTKRLKATCQALAIDYGDAHTAYEDRLYVTLEDDIASVAYWYQTLPCFPLPPLPNRSERAMDDLQ
jgi:hypothetical protein